MWHSLQDLTALSISPLRSVISTGALRQSLEQRNLFRIRKRARFLKPANKVAFTFDKRNRSMKDLLLTTLENSRAYTLAVAEAMPENFYDFKPTEAVWSFRELLHHIAYGIEWWNANNIEKVKIDWNPPVTEKNKPSVLKYLDRVYDTLKTTVEKASINDTTILGFSSTIDHITHHRGQAVTYLRCKGINPPEYSY